jgi:hypothetical protein
LANQEPRSRSWRQALLITCPDKRNCSDLDEIRTEAQDFWSAQQNEKIKFSDLIETELFWLMQTHKPLGICSNSVFLAFEPSFNRC